eukprot:scaffold12428_cov140-Skeletonema_dohrnii-CCMP3373.AAC.7
MFLSQYEYEYLPGAGSGAMPPLYFYLSTVVTLGGDVLTRSLFQEAVCPKAHLTFTQTLVVSLLRANCLLPPIYSCWYLHVRTATSNTNQ